MADDLRATAEEAARVVADLRELAAELPKTPDADADLMRVYAAVGLIERLYELDTRGET